MAGVDPNAFKAAAGSFGSGVTVVTAKQDGKVHGMTVSAFASVSLDPTQILVSLRIGSRVTGMINASGNFAVSVLREEQREIASHFATSGLELQDGSFPQFAPSPPSPAPIFEGSAGPLRLHVAHASSAATTSFPSRRVEAGSTDGEPLMYTRAASAGFGLGGRLAASPPAAEQPIG